MTHLLRFVFISCSVIFFAVSCSLIPRQEGKVIKTFVDLASLCAEKSIIYARSRKLICLLCKGFDPTCFSPATTTSTSTTTTTTTTPAPTTTSTTTPAPTTRATTPSTTTTTAAPPNEA